MRVRRERLGGPSEPAQNDRAAALEHLPQSFALVRESRDHVTATLDH